MANTADNVRVGVTGTVSYGATSLTLPATLTAAATSFTDVGYIGEDGITETQDTDTTDITAWQNGDVVRRVQTSHDLTYAFTLLETSTATQTLIYGAAAGAATPLEVTGDQPAHYKFVIDVVDGTKKFRICIPDGQITEKGDVVYASGEAVSYPITITCYPDSNGNKAYIYTGDAA